MILESHMLYLKIENTSPPGALEAMEKSKGWGLKIVQEIVQKYKGEWTTVLQEDALVRTEVILF